MRNFNIITITGLKMTLTLDGRKVIEIKHTLIGLTLKEVGQVGLGLILGDKVELSNASHNGRKVTALQFDIKTANEIKKYITEDHAEKQAVVQARFNEELVSAKPATKEEIEYCKKHGRFLEQLEKNNFSMNDTFNSMEEFNF